MEGGWIGNRTDAWRFIHFDGSLTLTGVDLDLVLIGAKLCRALQGLKRQCHFLSSSLREVLGKVRAHPLAVTATVIDCNGIVGEIGGVFELDVFGKVDNQLGRVVSGGRC